MVAYRLYVRSLLHCFRSKEKKKKKRKNTVLVLLLIHCSLSCHLLSTARVWSSYQPVMSLKGHTAAVWSVAIVPSCGKFITGKSQFLTGLHVNHIPNTGIRQCWGAWHILEVGSCLCNNSLQLRHATNSNNLFTKIEIVWFYGRVQLETIVGKQAGC